MKLSFSTPDRYKGCVLASAIYEIDGNIREYCKLYEDSPFVTDEIKDKFNEEAMRSREIDINKMKLHSRLKIQKNA